MCLVSRACFPYQISGSMNRDKCTSFKAKFPTAVPPTPYSIIRIPAASLVIAHLQAQGVPNRGC